MGYTITSQSSLSIHAGQTWSLVELGVAPGWDLAFWSITLDGNAFAKTPCDTTLMVWALWSQRAGGVVLDLVVLVCLGT